MTKIHYDWQIRGRAPLTSGTNTVFILDRPGFTLSPGEQSPIYFRAHAVNFNNVRLDVNGTGPLPIRYEDGTWINPGDLFTDGIYSVVYYRGANYYVLQRKRIIAPSNTITSVNVIIPTANTSVTGNYFSPALGFERGLYIFHATLSIQASGLSPVSAGFQILVNGSGILPTLTYPGFRGNPLGSELLLHASSPRIFITPVDVINVEYSFSSGNSGSATFFTRFITLTAQRVD